jgi:hypothetical protein
VWWLPKKSSIHSNASSQTQFSPPGQDQSNDSNRGDVATQEYGLFIERCSSCQFLRFVDQFRKQSGSQKKLGRAAVFEFPEGQPTRAKSFLNSHELESYFNSTRIFTGPEPRRRLLILEDLPWKYIEILISRFLVPPSSFATHWAGVCVADYNGRNSFRTNRSTGFLLRYAQFYKLGVDWARRASGNATLAANHNVERFCTSILMSTTSCMKTRVCEMLSQGLLLGKRIFRFFLG